MSNKEHTSIALRFILAFILMSGIFGAGLVGQVYAAPAKVNPVSVAGVALQSSFPSTGVLDDFDRSNGSIGSNWSGTTSGYAIAGNRLDVNSGGDIYWNVSYLGVNQEAYVTLTTIDQNADEIALVLKAQSGASMDPGQIAVVYEPASNSVGVWTFTTSSGWQQQGTSINSPYVNGDTFGARALATGQVEVYRNATLLGSRNVTGWAYYAYAGYIGLFHLNASNTVLENFGGGTMSGSPTLTPTTTAPTPTITATTTSCTDPTSCNPVGGIPALWSCNIAECTSADWVGAVISWPSWSAYQSNARTGDNSRSVFSFQDAALYPYMGAWADGCQVTAVTGTTLIIEWQRGLDTWRETYLNPGESHTIDLVSPEDGAMIEAPNGFTSFSVSLANCNPQNIFGPTFTPTFTPSPTPSSTPTSTSTPSSTPTATFTPSSTPSATATPSDTPTATSTPSDTPTATFTPSSTPTFTFTPSYTPTATFTPSNTPTATFTPSSTPTSTSTNTPTSIVTVTPTKTSKPNQPPLPTSPSQKSEAIFPAFLTTQSGSVSGSVSSLGLIQQNGADDDPSAYVRFQTPGKAYMGYKSFFLPGNAQPVNISSMLLQVNFKGPAASTQTWTWAIYDWTTGVWVKLGDNIGSQADQWNALIFHITSIARYVSPAREIRIRLFSNNQSDDAKIDYQALHVTYEPVEPTPTPAMPTPLSTKAKYTFPATYTPTATP